MSRTLVKTFWDWFTKADWPTRQEKAQTHAKAEDAERVKLVDEMRALEKYIQHRSYRAAGGVPVQPLARRLQLLRRRLEGDK